MSELLIGLTLVGFGTSTPELVTSIDAALRGSPGIALGNVLGSNIGNIFLILALVLIVRPIQVNPNAVRRDGVLAILASLALAAIGLMFGAVDRLVGGLLVTALAMYLICVWRTESRGGAASAMHQQGAHAHDPAPGSLVVSALFALGGLALLVWGADLLVVGAIAIARGSGISETVIGLTIVAIGTSLPELVATLVAALKGRADVAFGNIVGSNLYNILGILGVTALVHPIAVPVDVGVFDWAVMVGSAILLALFALTGRRLSRVEGLALLAMYGLYVGALFAR